MYRQRSSMQCFKSQLGLLQQQLQQLPSCVQHQHALRRGSRHVTCYQSKDLESLYQQAQQAPQITTPDLLSGALSQQQQEQQRLPRQQEQQHQQQQTQQLRNPSATPTAATHGSNLFRSAQQTQQLGPWPNKRLRPSKMEFAAMYAQLQAWQQKHMSAHVPRYCFDAPELGAWVRHMRKQYKDGLLEQWKADSLSALGFEWEPTNQQAKWHHLYHQLRRYRTLYGTTDIDVSKSSQDGCDWHLVEWWLRKQAKLLAKQKLSSQQRAMLEMLGVRLTVPKQLVQRTAQLQALNGTERRQLRKKWKLQDNMQHEARRQERQQELQGLLQQRRQQRQMEQQRQRLLRQAVAAAVAADGVDSTGAAGGQLAMGEGQAQEELVRIALQQLRSVQQLSLQAHSQPQQPAASDSSSPVTSAASELSTSADQQQHVQNRQEDVFYAVSIPASAHDVLGAAAAQGERTHQQLVQLTGQVPKCSVQHGQQHVEQAPSMPEQDNTQAQQQLSLLDKRLSPPREQQLEKQQQLQAPRTEAGALLFQPNRRRKKVHNRSRQEKWLAAAEGEQLGA